jgi:hypothetical protein
MLEVVEHEERSSVGERLVAGAHRVGDRPLDEAGVPERCELDEEDAVGELVDETGRSGEGKTRLSAAAGTCEGDESGRAEQAHELREVALAPDERRGLGRQVGVRRQRLGVGREGVAKQPEESLGRWRERNVARPDDGDRAAEPPARHDRAPRARRRRARGRVQGG